MLRATRIKNGETKSEREEMGRKSTKKVREKERERETEKDQMVRVKRGLGWR